MHEDIQEFIQNNGRDGNPTSIEMLSVALKRSKNSISKLVNQLVDEHVLICIEGSERFYYDKAQLENEFDLNLDKSTYRSERELRMILDKDEKRDFEKLIGYQDSLSYCVELCIAAISYPQNSLPVLLNGPTGTGKSMIAQLMYEYALNNGVIEEDSPFVIVNCSEYANNPELLTANLFGHKKGAFTGADQDNPGLIKVADGGVLFLDEVHCLKPECQEKLFLFMDKGIYHMVGENEVWQKSKVRMIFATTERPEDVLLKTFLRRVPIIAQVPSLQERGAYERIHLICSMFLEEEKRINKRIVISNFVYNMLMNHVFEGNIGELKNIIQVSCAKALRKSNDDVLSIHMEDIPVTMFSNTAISSIQHDADHRMITLQELNMELSVDSHLSGLYSKVTKVDNEIEFYETIDKELKTYYQHLMYDNKALQSHKDTYIMNRLESILKEYFKRYGCDISNNDFLSLYNYIEDVRRNLLPIRTWCDNHKDKVDAFRSEVKKRIPHEFAIVEKLMEEVKSGIDISFDAMFPIMLALNMKLMNQNTSTNKRIGILIAHGYSTASSIADATNQLLGDYVFQAMDMPIDMKTETIIERLNQFLSKHDRFEEIVLLVDMGSLEQLYKGIEVGSNVSIGIINNITTKIALEIGYGLKNKVPLSELLHKVCDQNEFRYHVLERKTKEKVIVCACASGMGTADKIRELLLSAFPTTFNVQIITYDYNTLLSKKMNCELFDRYEVLCIIGTLNPSIDRVLFVPIEELIVNQNINVLEHVFEEVLTVEEIDVFKHEILKSFSLTSIMNHLTILNPDKLLEHVAKALDDFQIAYGIQIHNHTSVGLYVHTCCMIERLVTRQAFDNYPNIKELQNKEEYFFQCIKQSFYPVEGYYGVEIPNDEIGYIYDYVFEGNK